MRLPSRRSARRGCLQPAHDRRCWRSRRGACGRRGRTGAWRPRARYVRVHAHDNRRVRGNRGRGAGRRIRLRFRTGYERTRRDRDRGRAGGRGVRRAARRRRRRRGAGRARAGRRRMRVLGVHALQGAAATRRAPGRGARVPGAERGGDRRLDAAAVLARRDEVIHDLDDGQMPWLEDRGITLVRGQARWTASAGCGSAISCSRPARAVVIAVGSGAAIPPVHGLAEISPWTNRQATTAKYGSARASPCSAAEPSAASSLRRGPRWAPRSTLVEALPRLLAGEEPFAGEQLAESLREQGVERPDREPGDRASARRQGASPSRSTDGEQLRSDELLVAVGRRPHTDDLGLETVDLEPGATIAVDDQMRVPGPRLAVRHRGRQRPRPADPRGQVPGPGRRRRRS